MRHAAAVLLVLAAGCAPAAPGPLARAVNPDGFGTVRFSVVAEVGVDPSAVLVAVMPFIEGSGIQSRTERVGLEGGSGSLELPAGKYRMWVGSRLSPDRNSPRVAPTMVVVDVRAGAGVPVVAILRQGESPRIPEGLGLPPASAGRLRVRCSQGNATLERWIALRPSGADEDLVWPPLPPGDWNLVVERADGSEGKFKVRIDGMDPRGAEVTPR